MVAKDVLSHRLVPGASVASVVSAMFTGECAQDAAAVAMPRPEVHLVVRFGPPTRPGLDVHALGPRRQVHRKSLPRGQRVVTARLRLGASQVVLGAPAPALAGHIVPLEDLWGAAAARHLYDRLLGARDTVEAAAVLARAIDERVAGVAGGSATTALVLAAAQRLTSERVNAVADELGVSERHLRRVFQDLVGMSPKAFAGLMRFRRALDAARTELQPNWAGIAASAGYYDQAHLIAEFRAISGKAPRALLGELQALRSDLLDPGAPRERRPRTARGDTWTQVSSAATGGMVI